ncbi:MAG: hypothetical protein U0457_03840 [Candidatus Sericytochromatia bacterium]
MSESIETEELEQEKTDYFSIGLSQYNNKEDYDTVIETFEKGVKENPRDSSYYTCLSWLHLLRNKGSDRKKAIDFAKTALRYDPNNAQAQYNLVLSYMLNGRKGIRDEFEKAISMSKDQDIVSAKTNLKDFVERAGNLDEVDKLLKWIEQA